MLIGLFWQGDIDFRLSTWHSKGFLVYLQGLGENHQQFSTPPPDKKRQFVHKKKATQRQPFFYADQQKSG